MESGPRIDLLMPRAKAPFVSQVLGSDVTECGLVFRGVVSGKMSAVVLKATGSFDRDDSALDRELDGVRNQLDRCPVAPTCQ